jgi:hypothetical protein
MRVNHGEEGDRVGGREGRREGQWKGGREGGGQKEDLVWGGGLQYKTCK